MKKVVSILAIVAFTNPLLPVYATSNSHKKKHKIHHQMKDRKMKDEAAIVAPPIVEEPASNLTGSMMLASNYMFRGISQSANNPAVQGGITYAFPIGIYANLWGSNVDFFAPDGRRATVEFDTILGYRGGIGENFTYDLNLARYNYPRARSANYNELNTLFLYKIIQLGWSYSANYAGTHASSNYYSLNLIFGIPAEYFFNIQDVGFQTGIGHYNFAKAAGNSYTDYNITLNKKITNIFTVIAQWTGTNGKAKLSPYDDNQINVAISASF
jgi:uncharacterized protein (TIGR02001 family)